MPSGAKRKRENGSEEGHNGSIPLRVFPNDTDLVGAFYKKQSTMGGSVWHRSGTYVRELRRLGFSLNGDRWGRFMQDAPEGLDYMQPPSGVCGHGERKSSYRPQPDLQDVNSKLKYFLVLDGIDDDSIERGARPMLSKCSALDTKEGYRVVALWVVSRVMLVKANKKSQPPDLRRCPEPGQVLQFKQPRRSACMAATPTSPLHGLNLSHGEVVDICPGAPRAVACVFVRFKVF